MRFKRLGRTGLKVSEICMGTMTFGSQTDEQAAHAILDRVLNVERAVGYLRDVGAL